MLNGKSYNLYYINFKNQVRRYYWNPGLSSFRKRGDLQRALRHKITAWLGPHNTHIEFEWCGHCELCETNHKTICRKL